jgi:Alpha/beta hydrolase family
MRYRDLAGAIALAVMTLCATAAAGQAQPGRIAGADCVTPAPLHCPDVECQSTTVINQGATVEPKTRRTFFLDCPAGYKPGDHVILVLSLHGAGSYANWQRNYFPLMDDKDKYHLVIMTPSSPTHVWQPEDDAYLQNIVDLVVGSVGKPNVDAFWLVGHSQGGITSNRIICTPYFADKVDVRISLSGGRLGSPPMPLPPGMTANPRMAAMFAAMNATPACTFSFIFSQGENEAKAQGGLPETSTWADHLGCAARVREPDVFDVKQGYVWDSSRQAPGSDAWGRYPKPGAANVWIYPNCKNGLVVADVLRLSKGHTEGYEPRITERIIELAASAPGGKIRNGSWDPPPPPQPFSMFGPSGGRAPF